MVCFPFVVVLQSVDFVMVSRFVSHHFADVLRFSQLFFVSGCHFAVAVVFLWCCCNSYWLLSISLVVSYHFVVAFWLFCGKCACLWLLCAQTESVCGGFVGLFFIPHGHFNCGARSGIRHAHCVCLFAASSTHVVCFDFIFT